MPFVQPAHSHRAYDLEKERAPLPGYLYHPAATRAVRAHLKSGPGGTESESGQQPGNRCIIGRVGQARKMGIERESPYRHALVTVVEHERALRYRSGGRAEAFLGRHTVAPAEPDPAADRCRTPWLVVDVPHPPGHHPRAHRGRRRDQQFAGTRTGQERETTRHGTVPGPTGVDGLHGFIVPGIAAPSGGLPRSPAIPTRQRTLPIDAGWSGR